MLEAVLTHLNNWFERNPATGGRSALRGGFEVAGGEMGLPEGWLSEGQHFRVVGSALNDGLHRHPASDLADEAFDGEVLALWVPPAVVELSERIGAWQKEHGEEAESPYQSEGFGGYSYSLRGTQGGPQDSSWRAVFASELRRWKRL